MTDALTLVTTPLTASGDHPGSRELLVVGPSIGTSVTALWSPVARRLSDRFDVVGFDLPGHGASPPSACGGDMAVLAGAVLAAVDRLARGRGDARRRFFYAGVSVSGCIGLQLLLDAPERLHGAVILNSAAKIGEPAAWHDRAALVRRDGPGALREGSAQRWFAPGFIASHPQEAEELLASLCASDAAGYAGVCEALASFDVRDRLARVRTPVLLIGGQDDVATPPSAQQALETGITGSRVVVLPDTGHLAPAEQPDKVAALMAKFFDSLARRAEG